MISVQAIRSSVVFANHRESQAAEITQLNFRFGSKAIDRFLDDPLLRKETRDDALKVIKALDINVSPDPAKRIGKDIGFIATGGVAVPAIPLVAVGVMIASQIRDTPSEPSDDNGGQQPAMMMMEVLAEMDN